MNHNPLRFRKPVCDKDCKNRTITCKFDGTCEKYKNEKAEIAKIKQNQKKDSGEILGYYKDRKQRRAL